jgi:hypothetical protein
MLVSEGSELTKDEHYYLYRYHALEGKFYRATVASGAGDLHFRVLHATDKIPLGGWNVIARSNPSKSHLQLVTQKEECSARSSTNDAKGKTFSDGTG